MLRLQPAYGICAAKPEQAISGVFWAFCSRFRRNEGSDFLLWEEERGMWGVFLGERGGYTSGSMIAHLRGRIFVKTPNQAVVECGGVGYEVTISVATFSALPGEGKEAAIHIYTHVREDQIALFGFAEMQEKRLFERLLTISGIGPKLAITVLSGISSERLVGAIRAQDHGTLTKIPGIGKKTAERVVLELKDKLDDLQAAIPEVGAGGGRRFGPVGDDALSALVNLGYPRPVAQRAIEAAIEKEPGVAEEFEQLFRAAMAGIR